METDDQAQELDEQEEVTEEAPVNPEAVISIGAVLYDNDTYQVFINDPLKTSASIVALWGLLKRAENHLDELTSETHIKTTSRLIALEGKIDTVIESYTKTLEMMKPLAEVVTGLLTLNGAKNKTE